MTDLLQLARPADPGLLTQKQDRLLDLLRSLDGVVIGFSGGVDSTLLAAAAHEVLGARALMVIARSESYPQAELRLAEELARSRGWNYRVIRTGEIDNPNYRRNDGRRCYFCKAELFEQLSRIARTEGYEAVAYGANQDDMSDHRPGHQAASDHGARSPLYEAGLLKSEIRALAREMDLPNWNKPAMACLSSRVAYGTEVTAELLRRIEAAEMVVAAEGFTQYRVRHHDAVARIELPAAEFGLLLEPERLQRIIRGVKAAGYTYVTLDLQGFRTGSMNDLLPKQE